jgi:hypothetical protein
MISSRFRPRNRRAWLRILAQNPLAIRFYKPWRDSLQPARSPLADQRPWITFAAGTWLSGRLHPHMRIFEWGSGGSTFFLAKHVRWVTTVEHDPVWYGTITAALHAYNQANISYTLIEPSVDPIETRNPYYRSTDPRYQGMSFKRYIEAIDQYPDGEFDFVLVDGRSRVGCMFQALAKVRPGGWLLLDNSERDEYAVGRDVVLGWRRRNFFGPGPYGVTFWSTTAWQRPMRQV